MLLHLPESNSSSGVNLSWKKGDLGDLQDVCSSCNLNINIYICMCLISATPSKTYRYFEFYCPLILLDIIIIILLSQVAPREEGSRMAEAISSLATADECQGLDSTSS